ncbi:MAG: hypothetical protein AMXMBFR53_01960 [Gemmatimonadota bacterium]
MRNPRPAWLQRLQCPKALRRLRRRAAVTDSAADDGRLLEAIVEHLPAMVFVKEAKSLRFVLFNREGEELLGIPRSAFLGRTDYDLFPAQQADFFTQKDREALEAHAPLEIAEEEILSPAMGLRILRTRKVAIRDEAGMPQYLLGISVDITELKKGESGRREAEDALAQREAHYRSLLEYATDIVVVVDVTGVIVFAGPSSGRILGYTVEELRGSDIFSAIHDDDKSKVRRAFHRALEDHTDRPTVEYRLRDKAGRWRILESTATNALANPAVAGVVVNSRDITERVDLQNRYLHAQRMEALGNLAGGVAHDFNNLLSVIMLSASVLLEDMSDSDPTRPDVSAIATAAESAAALTRQLLAFSRRQVLQPGLVDLSLAVRELEPLIRRILGEDVVLETALHDGVPAPHVFFDRGQLEQVLVNLSVNARHAMPTGGTLTIRVRVDADEVHLEVADDGVGMSEETRARAFEPFFTTKATGTGLGLATVYGIVQQSKGRITLDSEPGEGTVFRICLPRAEGGVSRARPTTEDIPRALPGETILVVDDRTDVRAALRRLLSRIGYEVLLAIDGEDGMQVVTGSHRVDLVLADVVMPRMRGTELAFRVQEVRPGLPVILMTGYTDSEKGIELPRTATVLTKPLALGPLARSLRQAIDGHRTRRPAWPKDPK